MTKKGDRAQMCDGDVSVWIEQEAIHLKAVDSKHGDPVELTVGEARQLAAVLLRFADKIVDR